MKFLLPTLITSCLISAHVRSERDPFSWPTGASGNSAQNTTRPYELVGTVHTSKQKDHCASMKYQGKSLIVWEGTTLPDGSTVIAIEREQVTIKKGNESIDIR